MSTTTNGTTVTVPLLSSLSPERRQSSDQPTSTPDPPCTKTMIIILPGLIWNMIIVSAAIAVVIMSKDVATTKVPVRVWVVGYGVLRLLHMVFLCVDYLRWREANKALFLPFDADNSRYLVLDRGTMFLQSVKSLLNLIWWVIGLYWILSGGKMLPNDAPKLFWFTAIFLGVDLFTVFIQCIIFVANWCCISNLPSTPTNAPHLVQV